MTAADLDAAYSELCAVMTQHGEDRERLFLARMVLLAMVEIEDPAILHRIIVEASDGVAEDFVDE